MNEIPTPTQGELEILKVLWELGPTSVRSVYEHLRPQKEKLAYNTIQTLLRIMEEKGLVQHHVEGRAFVYQPRYSRDESAVRFLDRVLDRVFDGAATQLVTSLLKIERVTPEELQEMHAMIAEARRSKVNHRIGKKPRTT